MIYTAYTEDEYNNLPKKYRKDVLGISYKKDILQVPLCPECGGDMMEVDEYLSCTVCGYINRKRVIKDEEPGDV